MEIVEIRECFAKIATEDDIELSSLLKISMEDSVYIAQVVQTKQNFIIAKILFTIDEQNSLQKYNYEFIDTSADVSISVINDLNSFIKSKFPICTGVFGEDKTPIFIDKQHFNKKLLICLENLNALNILVKNLAKQFGRDKGVVVIDTLGIISAAKSNAGVDYKLPLNSENLDFVYNTCLSNATGETKNSIKEIFADLAEYVNEVGYLPFATLKSIIDDMVDKSHIFKLLVFKNELNKLEKTHLFANKTSEILDYKKLRTISAKQIFDLSKVNACFVNNIIRYIYKLLEQEEACPQVFLTVSETVEKKTLKMILESSTVPTTIITTPNYKSLDGLQTLFHNVVIDSNLKNNVIFKKYATFLKMLKNNQYLISGTCTNDIQLISSAENLDESLLAEIMHNIDANGEMKDSSTIAIENKSNALIEKIEKEVQENKSDDVQIFSENPVVDFENDDLDIASAEAIPVELQEDGLEPSFKDELSKDIPFQTEIDETKVIDIPVEIEEEIDNSKIIAEDEALVNSLEDELTIEQEDEALTEDVDEDLSEISVEELSEPELIEAEGQLDEHPVERVLSDAEEIVIDNTQGNSFEDTLETEDVAVENESFVTEQEDVEELVTDFTNTNEQYELDTKIAEDVDKVYTTIQNDEDIDLSESDLDFIDELNGETQIEQLEPATEGSIEELNGLPLEEELESEELEFSEPIEEIQDGLNEVAQSDEILETKNPSTPMVPIYDADIPKEDTVMSDDLEQGDVVTHIKYGSGVVEKLVKYGSKTLAMINFENNGRKLLDPTLAEIKKA